jgi:hypothetical protein
LAPCCPPHTSAPSPMLIEFASAAATTSTILQANTIRRTACAQMTQHRQAASKDQDMTRRKSPTAVQHTVCASAVTLLSSTANYRTARRKIGIVYGTKEYSLFALI